jgi:hypothetical protein
VTATLPFYVPTFVDFRDHLGRRWCHLYGSRDRAEACARRVVEAHARDGITTTYVLREARR